MEIKYWKKKHITCYALQNVRRSVKTCRMSQNANLIAQFIATSELFPELFKLYLNDIHIQSYN